MANKSTPLTPLSEAGAQAKAIQGIVLLAPHEHGGREYPVGAKLTLDADAADWLIGLGAAQAV